MKISDHLKITLAVVVLAAISMYFGLVPNVFAADKTITPAQAKETRVGGLPIFLTFQSSDVGTADSVVIDGPVGFMPDFVHGFVAHTTSSLIIGCDWYRGMATGEGHVIANNGTRAYTATAAVSLDEATGNITFGAECHTDDAPFAGWAGRYAE